MKYRPILFSGPMVRAILEGRKTQTRRVAKMTASCHVKEPRGHRRWHPADPEATLACPYGQPGDRLWVRETHAPQADCWGAWGKEMECYNDGPKPIIHYRADGGEPFIEKWHPSIHMPRWASRITLEVTDVRVQRLQDISEEDAQAEGADQYRHPVHPNREALRHVDGFHELWNSINGSGSWEANPWVWALSFKVMT